MRPLCHDDESLALLKFKESFTINQSASDDPSAYPKVLLWKPESGDCCRWRGVKCNEDTGHVISLDLSSSCLYGSFNSNSSLFQLVHLQSLNLANNHFNYSRIPTGFRQLSRLTDLNLSYSAFSGQITSEILERSNLVFLDLSFNSGLKLQKHGLRSIAQKLTNLKELDLSEVDISSTLPNILANLSSLTSLLLIDCGLHGEFPTGIFHLPNLSSICVRYNTYLTGSLPEFNRSSPLESLQLRDTSFSGELPNSIGYLESLKYFAIGDCNFSGPIPSSFGNLTQLILLQLANNSLHGEFPTRIFHLPNLLSIRVGYNTYLTGSLPEFNRSSPLESLQLRDTSFSGELPNSIGYLESLKYFAIGDCNFSGPIPSSFGNLTQLILLELANNSLHGSIPQSISRLMNLENLHLSFNHLSGTVEFDLFLKLKNLKWLQLSRNNISLLTKPSTNTTLPKFEILNLASCDLSEFPDFLRNQDELVMLDLSENKIYGQIPNWMWNSNKETLWTLALSSNFLTGFDQVPVFVPWTNLRDLELDSNNLRGSLPIPPPPIYAYSVSHNTLTGEIPQLICNLSSIVFLDVSSNYLSGLLPQCLGNLSDSLSVLNLHNNSFHGTIPETFIEGNKLKMIDFSQNQLQGRLPRSLANCIMLEVLNLGHNQMNDTFPFWLGTLPELRVLILRSNGIYGAMENPNSNFDFSNIRIFDLSNNDIAGKLPSQYFQNWKAMQIHDVKGLIYMETNGSFSNGTIWHRSFAYSMTFTYKSTEREYEKILDVFIAIDLSNNSFEGEIPEVVGYLKGLQVLNLSNNFLTGPIPSSLVNLTNLEVLDFAQNKLSGVIPVQLVQLTFLSFFNVSHNHLMGPIPHGKQFDTFPNSSFSGNSKLCGSPLSKKCENLEDSQPPPSTSEKNQNSSFLFEFDWKVVVMGYGCGIIFGLVVGQIVFTKKHDLIMKTFAIGQPTRRRVNRRRYRN
ncbi:receptor-like protein 6 [Alnus glutinosa]|uniref:receptor-like protein 6 n=1 Tax=Alnus glutinosa TaxID=3517 RepID=UPI002D7811D3|nr:receptor-like protein 6 [Alnus glutinosa]